MRDFFLALDPLPVLEISIHSARGEMYWGFGNSSEAFPRNKEESVSKGWNLSNSLKYLQSNFVKGGCLQHVNAGAQQCPWAKLHLQACNTTL